MMATRIDNTQDILDSRDIIERIVELQESAIAAVSTWEAGTWAGVEYEGKTELAALKALADEAEGADDWEHGATLIRDSYFEAYARELAEDIGAISDNAEWPVWHIDWGAAAQSLQMDYCEVDFDGVTYWVR